MILNVRRKSQPPEGTRANPYWVARGLVALFDTRAGIEVISGARSSVSTAGLLAGEAGQGADFSGTANQRWAHRPEFALTGASTVIVFCDIDAATNYGALVSKQASPTTYCPFELRVGLSATDTNVTCLRAATAGYSGANLTTSLIGSPPKTSLHIAARWFASTADIQGVISVNGVGGPEDYYYSGAHTDPVADNGADVWIGRRSDGATQLDGRIYYVALFDTPLSDSEIFDASRSPWDMFAPQQLWVPQTVALSLPALSLPTYVPGSLTSSGFRPRVTAS